MRRTFSSPSRSSSSRSIAARLRRVRSRSFRPLAVRLEDRTLLSTVTWINPSGGDWDTPSNWSNDAVPGPSDDAVIDTPSITVTHSSSASDSVNSLTISSSDTTLDPSGGSLALATASSIAGNLSMEGATLSTEGDLTVTGALAIADGSLVNTGAGAMTVNAYGPVSFAVAVLDGVTFNNHAEATFAASTPGRLSYVNFLDGTAFNNLPGATLVDDGGMYGTSNGNFAPGSGQFNNAGTYVETAPGGSYGWFVPFLNTGSVNVQQGDFDLGDGCGAPLPSDPAGSGRVTGSFYGAPGTTMNLGYEDLAATASVVGDTVSIAGQVRCPFQANTTTASGTFTNPDVSVGNLAVGYDSVLDLSPTTGPQTLAIGNLGFEYAGTLQGSDNFAVSGTLTTVNGCAILGSAGSSLAANNITIVPGSITLDGRAITATGTVTWEADPTIIEESVVTADGATFTSEGTFIDDVPAGANHTWGTQYTDQNGVGTGSFLNEGSYVLEGGGDYSEFRVPFTNTGTVDVQAGTLAMGVGALSHPTDAAGPGTVTGTFIGDPGTTMDLGYQELGGHREHLRRRRLNRGQHPLPD